MTVVSVGGSEAAEEEKIKVKETNERVSKDKDEAPKTEKKDKSKNRMSYLLSSLLPLSKAPKRNDCPFIWWEVE